MDIVNLLQRTHGLHASPKPRHAVAEAGVERVRLLRALVLVGCRGIIQSLGVPLDVLADDAPSLLIQDRIEDLGGVGRLIRDLHLVFAVVASAASARVLPNAPSAPVFVTRFARDLPRIMIIRGRQWVAHGRARPRPRAWCLHRDHRKRGGSLTREAS